MDESEAESEKVELEEPGTGSTVFRSMAEPGINS